MIKKLKPGKISIVVCLTVLIWVWADLAQDDRLSLSDVRIEVAKSTDPVLWVNFVVEGADPNLQTSVALETVELKGPASRVAEVSRRKNRGAIDLNLFLVPEQEGLTLPETRPINVLEFLRKNQVIRDLGLAVESCKPERLTLQAQTLVLQEIGVECVGLDPSLQAVLDPSSITAYVPAGKTLKAKIPPLTAEEQTQAKAGAIEKTPYVELVQNQRRETAAKVKVTLSPVQNLLTEDKIPATYRFCLSPNLVGKYTVKLENDQTELTRVSVRGTDLARQAYRRAPAQLLLYIEDQDAQTPPDKWPISREFVFAFPPAYVRLGQIEQDQPPPVAKFRLVPIGTPTNAGPESFPLALTEDQL
jgi:hypothetical protein